MKILGIGHFLPELKRLNDTYHPKKSHIEAIKYAGYDKYWISCNDARSMGAQAVRNALEESGHNHNDIGFIVAAQSNIPDFIAIDFACQVGSELGDLQKVKTVNLVEGCATSITSWLAANSLVDSLMPGKVGVVVLAQRVSESHVDRFGLMNAILTDGAAAAIVGKLDTLSDTSSFVYRGGEDISDTRFVDMVRIERGGGINPFVLPDHDAREDKLGREIMMEHYQLSANDLEDFLKLRMENTIEVIQSSLNKVQWGNNNFTLIHTLEGKQSMENLASQFGIPIHKTNINLLSEIGHMGCVDQLISLDLMRKEGRFNYGEHIVMSSISSGMKWGSCLFECIK